jgi:hypothetical protein
MRGQAPSHPNGRAGTFLALVSLEGKGGRNGGGNCDAGEGSARRGTVNFLSILSHPRCFLVET